MRPLLLVAVNIVILLYSAVDPWNLFIMVTLGTMLRWPAYGGWWCIRIVIVDGVWDLSYWLAYRG